MTVRPSPAIAKQLSMLALSLEPSNDERAAAINMFMGGAMLCAFHAKENPGADIDGLMDFVNERCRETIKEIMFEEVKGTA